MPATKKSSPAKAAAARANGANSHGPKTDAGKRKSSQNAFKHGCATTASHAALLPGEDAAKLQACADAFYRYFCPQDLAEAAIVDTLIAQIWRSARATGFETELLTSDAEDLHPTLADKYESITITRLFALAFRESSGKDKPALAIRYLVSSRNMYRSALSDLARMRQLKGNPENFYVQPPQFRCAISSFCIDPSLLPVSGVEHIVHPPPQPSCASEADAAPPPAPEPSPEPPQSHSHPEPSAQPAPPDPTEPEPAVQPEPPAASVEPEELPMIPFRDPDGAIALDMTGLPMMLRNPKWKPTSKPVDPRLLQPPPLSPYEKYNTELVPLLMRDSLFPNEPKPPLPPGAKKK